MNYTAKKNTAIATGSADYAIILQNIYDDLKTLCKEQRFTGSS